MLILFLRRALSSYQRIAAIVLALGILISLFVLGAQPVAVNLIPSPWDKLAHAVIFALLTCGIGVASGLHGRRALLVAITTAVLVGVLDEWHQLYLPGRQASWHDLAADIAGSMVGTMLLAMRYKRACVNDGG